MRIQLTNVRKQFDGAWALDGVSLDVASGGRIALVGPNGSGKSTLIRAVMGLVRCEGILLDGLDPFTQRPALAARIAYVPQSAPQIASPVREVVRAVAEVRGLAVDDIHRAAKAMQLDLHEVARRPVRALSGGMKQKLLIALAFSAPVSLLVLDEPTASLEARARDAFFELFAERSAGATLLLSSHRPDEVERLVDRVVALESGRVAWDGAVGDMAANRALELAVCA